MIFQVERLKKFLSLADQIDSSKHIGVGLTFEHNFIKGISNSIPVSTFVINRYFGNDSIRQGEHTTINYIT